MTSLQEAIILSGYEKTSSSAEQPAASETDETAAEKVPEDTSASSPDVSALETPQPTTALAQEQEAKGSAAETSQNSSVSNAAEETGKNESALNAKTGFGDQGLHQLLMGLNPTDTSLNNVTGTGHDMYEYDGIYNAEEIEKLLYGYFGSFVKVSEGYTKVSILLSGGTRVECVNRADYGSSGKFISIQTELEDGTIYDKRFYLELLNSKTTPNTDISSSSEKATSDDLLKLYSLTGFGDQGLHELLMGSDPSSAQFLIDGWHDNCWFANVFNASELQELICDFLEMRFRIGRNLALPK